MNVTESRCRGCGRIFTHHGLGQHLAKTHRVRCRVVHNASQPQSRFRSSPYERSLLTLPPNSASWGYPNPYFGRRHPSGHGGTPSDSPAFLPLGNEAITTGNMNDRKLASHRSGTYTKLTTATNVDNSNNNADDQANDTAAGGDAMPDTADMTDTADATDANVFETITQVHTDGFLDSDSTVPNPEQIPSAESESPPETPPNPLGQPSSPDARSQVVVERFRRGNPGAPINGTQGSPIYESSQETLGGSVWAPFRSECDWNVAHWAKMNGPSATALTGLLAIPNVRLTFFCFTAVAQCS